MVKNEYESRFQWSVQKSVKIKAVPFIIKELKQLGNAVDLEILENDFNWKYHIIVSENVAPNQRPFQRTMFFIKEDLGLLNDDYTLKKNIPNISGEDDILFIIYNGAVSTLVPFKKMLEIFKTLNKEKYDWEELKNYLSRDLILLARDNHSSAFKKKDKITEGGVYYWKIDDPSLHRLVQLGRLLGICSFVVLKHVRFINDFEKGSPKKTIDLNNIIEILREIKSDLNESSIFSLDEIMRSFDDKDVPFGVIEDAILTDNKSIKFYSGRKHEKLSIKFKGKKYYRLSFTKEALEGEEI